MTDIQCSEKLGLDILGLELRKAADKVVSVDRTCWG